MFHYQMPCCAGLIRRTQFLVNEFTSLPVNDVHGDDVLSQALFSVGSLEHASEPCATSFHLRSNSFIFCPINLV